jgi:hypothetical protein
MHSREIITPEANRSDSCPLPKRHGAAWIQRDSDCIPVVAAKVHDFRLVGWSFEQSVHIFAPGLKSSSNHKALLAAKFNQARLDGEPHNPFGLLSAKGVVSARDEFPKRQGFLPAIGFHCLKYRPGNRAGAMGCSPHVRFSWIRPGTRVRDKGASTGRWIGDWSHHSCKPSAGRWLCRFGGGARKTACTVCNN